MVVRKKEGNARGEPKNFPKLSTPTPLDYTVTEKPRQSCLRMWTCLIAEVIPSSLPFAFLLGEQLQKKWIFNLV